MLNPAPSRAIRLGYAGVVIVMLAAGILVRSWGVLVETLDFWADEAWWATLLETRSLDEFGFRPVGYMWLCRELLGLGVPAEIALRLPSLAAGIAALVFIHRAAELTVNSRATALFVLLVAVLHPKLVVFAKEFKPYSVELFIFSALTCWALHCLRRGRPSVPFLVASVAALPFCYPVVLLYPALVLAFAGGKLDFLRNWPLRRRLYAAAAAVAALAFLHLYAYEWAGAASSRLFWGRKYDVFPIDAGILGSLAWYARKTWDLMSLPGGLDGMGAPVSIAFGAAYAGGVAALIAARRHRELAILCGPLVMAALANALGYWPYGAFRANLFLLPAALLVLAQAVDWLAARQAARYFVYAALAGILVTAARIEPERYRAKLSRHWAASPELAAVLDEIERRRADAAGPHAEVILADWHSWRPILYYLPRYPGMEERVRLVRGPIADAAGLSKLLESEVARAHGNRTDTRLWLVVTNLGAHRKALDAAAVKRHAVRSREFATWDRDYHPVLVELRF